MKRLLLPTITASAFMFGSLAAQSNNPVLTPFSIYNGGTGSRTAAGARTNLGLSIGGTVQAWDADLDSIAALGVSRGSLIYGNATPAWDELTIGAANSLLGSDGTDAAWFGCTAAGRAILDDATAADRRTTLGVTGTGADTTYAFRANNLSDLAAPTTTARTNLGVGTGDSPQFAAVNIGDAADTTITRVSAGLAAVEGATVLAGVTQYAVALGGGAGAAGSATIGTAGRVLLDQGAGANPAFTTLGGAVSSVQADGDVLIAWPDHLPYGSDVIGQTLPAWAATSATTPVSGTLVLYPAVLYKGTTVGYIRMASTTAATGPTNWRFGLYSTALALLAQTANQGAAAWAANTVQTIAVTSSYAVPTTAVYLVGMYMAAATPVTLVASGAFATALSGLEDAGAYDAGLTTDLPDPAALTNDAFLRHVWIEVLSP